MILKKIFFVLLLTITCNFVNAQEQPTPAPVTQEANVALKTNAIAYITIEGMACQEGCADAIAKNLKEVEGIQSADVSFADGKAIVRFDQHQVELSDIENVITETKVKDYVYTIKNSVFKDRTVR